MSVSERLLQVAKACEFVDVGISANVLSHFPASWSTTASISSVDAPSFWA
ncbi:hypothetical protein SGLAU_32005 [Streptomyces glaucescens]|uniref:Uncharacterized protein n=1 Tax=Streptomyces glaucescens TaxID=1907 RepID=A0A089XM88_STRGA|nr:hypothetical protein SGLAU_32005 [Streptomyces glaucescens]